MAETFREWDLDQGMLFPAQVKGRLLGRHLWGSSHKYRFDVKDEMRNQRIWVVEDERQLGQTIGTPRNALQCGTDLGGDGAEAFWLPENVDSGIV